MADVVALSPTTPHPSSLAAAADAFLDDVDVAATTRRVYRASLAALVHGLGPARAMPELTAELVDDWFRARYATVAPATWNRELATLRSAVAWWRAHGWLATDPTSSLARRREHPDRTRALSRAELEMLWRRDDLRLRDKTLWRLLYETAARASEALDLNLEDLDLANKRARVSSKGGAVEWIHWQTGTARLLARLVAGRTSGPVFLADRAPTGPVPAGDLDPVSGRARLSYRRAAHLFHQTTGWTLHQLRHSALTHEAEDGTNTPMLLARSRHASVRSLERYARPGPEAVARHVAQRDPAARRRYGSSTPGPAT
jgi:integrase/recombinase XerD